MQAAGAGRAWRSLAPDSGTWSTQPLRFTGNTSFENLYGNLGAIRAYQPPTDDAPEGTIYCLLTHGQQEKIHLAGFHAESR